MLLAKMYEHLRYALTVVINVAVFTGCINRDVRSKPFLVGKYEYVAYNKTGNAVITGTLTIDALRADQFNGRWLFSTSHNSEEVHGLDGGGELIGSVDQKAVTINFNPTMFDANWIVDATIEGDQLVGILRWSGYAGGPEIGTFEGTRVSHP